MQRMTRRTLWLTAAVVAALVVGLVGAAAVAGPGGPPSWAGQGPGWAGGGGPAWRGGGAGFGPMGSANTMTAIADELGVTVTDLRQARWDGKSIAALAEEKGVSLENVKAAALAAAQANHDAAVAAGYLTTEQALERQELMASQLDKTLTATAPLGPGAGMGPLQGDCVGRQGPGPAGRAGGFGPGRGMGRGFGAGTPPWAAPTT